MEVHHAALRFHTGIQNLTNADQNRQQSSCWCRAPAGSPSGLVPAPLPVAAHPTSLVMDSPADEHDDYLQAHREKDVLPAEGLRVYCGDGDSRQYALLISVANVLAGVRCQVDLLLTDADYKPLEPAQLVNASQLVRAAGLTDEKHWQYFVKLGTRFAGDEVGTSMQMAIKHWRRTHRFRSNPAKRSGGGLDSKDAVSDSQEGEEEEEGEEEHGQQDDLPAEGLRVYCGDDDSRLYALLTTLANVLAGVRHHVDFLLTDADYKPLEPPQHMNSSQFVKAAGFTDGYSWKHRVKLGTSFVVHQVGTSVEAVIKRWRRIHKFWSRPAKRSGGGLESGDADSDSQEEEEHGLQDDLPAEGLRVYCGVGDSRQYALWTSVAEVLAGYFPGQGFLLTDADYQPLKPPQHMNASQFVRAAGFTVLTAWRSHVKLGKGFASDTVGTSVATVLEHLRCSPAFMSRHAKRSGGGLNSGDADSDSQEGEEEDEEEEQEKEEEEEHGLQDDLPAEGLRVYCGVGDSRQYALLTTVANVLAGVRCQVDLLLTDADYKPLEPPQLVHASRFVSSAGLTHGKHWQQAVKLGTRFAGDEVGTAMQTVIKHWRRTNGFSSSPAKRSGGGLNSGDADSDSQEEEEHGLQELPAEGLRVYCGVGDSRQYALLISVANVLAGIRCQVDFLLTDADYKPLEPSQLVNARQFVSAAGLTDGKNWQNFVKLGTRFAGDEVGTAMQTAIKHWRRTHGFRSKPAKRSRAAVDMLDWEDADSESSEEEEAGEEVLHQARQRGKKQKLLAAHTTQPSTSSQGPRDGVDLSLLPPLPPLKYKTSTELILQSEIELMSGLAGLLHVLGHGDAWRQLWHRYLHHYITSSLTMRLLDEHYKALQAAVKSESVPAIKAVLRDQFKLGV